MKELDNIPYAHAFHLGSFNTFATVFAVSFNSKLTLNADIRYQIQVDQNSDVCLIRNLMMSYQIWSDTSDLFFEHLYKDSSSQIWLRIFSLLSWSSFILVFDPWLLLHQFWSDSDQKYLLIFLQYFYICGQWVLTISP